MESKRIFNQAKMNRDIDDRLLPEGSYRYANNVNIGESEGGDIGAVENLKGNEQIGTTEGGTTIGVVRDPNNDRVYWFNKGEDYDTIYEYDESTGAVVPILKDSVDRDLVKPTCVPNFTTNINEPASDENDRPDLEPEFNPQKGGACIVEFGPNGRPNTNYDASATFQTGTCIEEDPPAPEPDFTVEATLASGSPVTGTDITLTATPSNAVGTVTYSWSGGSLTDTNQTTDPFTEPSGTTTVTYTVEATDDNETVSDTIDVIWSDAAKIIYDFIATSSGTAITGTSIDGAQNYEITEDATNQMVTFVSTYSISDTATNQWDVPPGMPTVTGEPTGITPVISLPATDTTDPAMVSFTGSYTVVGNVNLDVSWPAGASIEVIPMAPAVNYEATNYQSNSGSGGISNQFIRSGTAASVHAELIQLNEFGLITLGGTLNVNFTATPLVSSGGNVDQTIQLNSFILPGDAVHNVQYQWNVDAAIDTTWNIIINTVEITDFSGDVTGTTGLITGSPSPGLTRSGSGGGTP